MHKRSHSLYSNLFRLGYWDPTRTPYMCNDVLDTTPCHLLYDESNCNYSSCLWMSGYCYEYWEPEVPCNELDQWSCRFNPKCESFI